MSNTKKSLAERYLNDLGNFKDDIKSFQDRTIHAVNDKAFILKNAQSGKTSNYSKSQIIDKLEFQINMGLMIDTVITAENAQSRFVEVCSILP